MGGTNPFLTPSLTHALPTGGELEIFDWYCCQFFAGEARRVVFGVCSIGWEEGIARSHTGELFSRRFYLLECGGMRCSVSRGFGWESISAR